jgi:hypothetical protein
MCLLCGPAFAADDWNTPSNDEATTSLDGECYGTPGTINKKTDTTPPGTSQVSGNINWSNPYDHYAKIDANVYNDQSKAIGFHRARSDCSTDMRGGAEPNFTGETRVQASATRADTFLADASGDATAELSLTFSADSNDTVISDGYTMIAQVKKDTVAQGYLKAVWDKDQGASGDWRITKYTPGTGYQYSWNNSRILGVDMEVEFSVVDSFTSVQISSAVTGQVSHSFSGTNGFADVDSYAIAKIAEEIN